MNGLTPPKRLDVHGRVGVVALLLQVRDPAPRRGEGVELFEYLGNRRIVNSERGKQFLGRKNVRSSHSRARPVQVRQHLLRRIPSGGAQLRKGCARRSRRRVRQPAAAGLRFSGCLSGLSFSWQPTFCSNEQCSSQGHRLAFRSDSPAGSGGAQAGKVVAADRRRPGLWTSPPRRPCRRSLHTACSCGECPRVSSTS